ncbi:MAG: MaoC family dehydratase [Calditrichaeota bacterium]|nr:MaoC family dehydratase [Calditrichota bacterium]
MNTKSALKHNFSVGDTANVTKTFTREDVLRFAEISGDTNPIHVDENYAKNHMFGKCVVHGMLVASLFSGLLGQQLPGEGSVYLGQSLSFRAPVFIGDAVTASVEIIRIRADKPIVTLKTICKNQDGVTVIEGEAVIKI